MSQARRAEAADKLMRTMRPVLVALVILGALAVVDLFTGSVMDDRQIDAVLLAGCALSLWGFFEMRWVANRIRTNQVQRPLGVGRWLLIVTGSLLTLVFVAAMGYVTGGPWLAVVLVGAVFAVTAIGIVRARRQRQRTDRAVL